ncbi:DeoR/GlpR family DNA-binding transcription regulator [Paenibacillus favisporus]|uniref:DeoR/GlpR family DNA-binding transcription regulator n=1 Tax=Paenibacillus favisporus TaxID=221028 RepID=UPI0013D1CF78|nr:DeoR/GlpR family DNA-binding transcription regulator [Paenibacillus favisporus]
MKPEAHRQLNSRQSQMLNLISREGEVRIAELRESFPVTEMTIRRDLEKLEETGVVKRTFGGAIFVGQDLALKERTGILTDEKIRIGRKAASLVHQGDSLFLDGGTTTLQVARYLPSDQKLTVVTNALNVAQELTARGIPTTITGGTLLESTLSLVGPIAVQNLSGMAFDLVFLGATGIDAEHGFSNSNFYEAEIKSFAIRQAAEAVVVLDHTKFGARALASFSPLKGVGRIVTDELPEETLFQTCKENGVQVEVADRHQ